jgi:hypothetical protein
VGGVLDAAVLGEEGTGMCLTHLTLPLSRELSVQWSISYSQELTELSGHDGVCL